MSGVGRRSRCRRVPPLMLALAAAGVVLAGCGSGSRSTHGAASVESSSDGARTGFILQVDKVCARAWHALTPPAADAASWQSLLGLVDEMATNAQRQIAAARARDVPVFVHTVATTNERVTKINAAGTRFGFTQESACSQVFG